MIKGISVLNPVDVERDYYLFCVDYAISHGFDHLQLIGPIHDYVKGNLDGMTYCKKYAQFNTEKDSAYIEYCMEVVNEATKKAHEHNIKNYMWHHELYLPEDFKKVYPEILNDYGDVEVSHPLVQDYLEHKIGDFFDAYPYMDGLILTLHETSIPLLKLKNQKLGKIERVSHVTGILFNACAARGKELIVRPFASIEEDYEMMTKAYEEISDKLIIMDKWTQFDWSLAMPCNPFFNKIKKNPLFVEGDVFGEYFGKGNLPIMLDAHLKDKFEYCAPFNPIGYVGRIDRNAQDPFGDVNEVNLEIMHACLCQTDTAPAIEAFFKKKYPNAADEVRALMEPTEQIITDIFYLNAFLFSQLSIFPNINHSKNHFYFEMMRDDYRIASNEWFIPKNWVRPALEDILSVKKAAADKAGKLFRDLETLQDKIEKTEYEKLYTKFYNLKSVAEIWYVLTQIFIYYARYFRTRADADEAALKDAVQTMRMLAAQGIGVLGDKFYCNIGSSSGAPHTFDYVENFAREVLESFEIEKKTTAALESETGLIDFVLCGGGMEGHALQKEVNFSDVCVQNGKLCRLPGNGRGKAWSSINAHGWFSYEVKVKPNSENIVKIAMENPEGVLSCTVQIGETIHDIAETACGEKEIALSYTAGDETHVRIRIDRNASEIPYVYTIKIL